MAAPEPILFTRVDKIARIVLNRPDKRNALNAETVAAVKDALAAAAADPETHVVVISGAGRDFCSGADLTALARIASAGPKENMDDARSLGALFVALRRHPKPVVAAVRGRALAGGCGLAIACDVVLAAESAQFGFPEVNIGFVPAMVSAIVRRSLSEKQAFDLLAVGEPISATTALGMGLITRVFPDDGFEEEAEGYVARLASKSATAVSLTKSVLAQADGLSFEMAIETGAHVNTMARMTDDCRRGIETFLSRSRR
jgi:methylglutaconyl-CoA hydratase